MEDGYGGVAVEEEEEGSCVEKKMLGSSVGAASSVVGRSVAVPSSAGVSV